MEKEDKRSLLRALALAEAAFAEAEASYRHALEVIERSLGADHPETATLHRHLADLAHSRGRHAESEAHARRALEVRTRAVSKETAATSVSGQWWRPRFDTLLTRRRGDLAAQLRKAALACTFSSALGGTRTPNLLIRSQMLYPLSYERWVLLL